MIIFVSYPGKVAVEHDFLLTGILEGVDFGEGDIGGFLLLDLGPSTSVSANWTGNTAPSEKASPSTAPTREKARMRRWCPSRGRRTAGRLTPPRSSMENMS